MSFDAEKQQPDPFVLPAETDGRFRMLIVTAVLLVWSLGALIIPGPSVLDETIRIGPNFRRLVGEAMDQAKGGFGQLRMPTPEVIAAIKNSPEAARMLNLFSFWTIRFLLSITLLVIFVLLAVCFYRLSPVLLKRHHKIRPLDPLEAPRVVAELEQVAARIGLCKIPQWSSMAGMLGGLAFVQSGRPVLAVAGEPKMLQRVWSDFHRVVALHELGHFVNGDSGKREIAKALWISLGAVLALAVFLFLEVQEPGPAEVGTFVVRTLGVVLLAWAMWGGLVRSREFYADWRVLTWGMGPALARRLSLSAAAPPRLAGFWLDFWPPWRMHPSNTDRLRTIREPTALFVVSPLLAILTGALLGLLAGNIGTLALDGLATLGFLAGGMVIWFGSPQVLFAAWLVELVVPPIVLVLIGRWITDALGIQILRASLLSLDRDSYARWGYRQMAFLALEFVVGVELGLMMTSAAFLGWSSVGFIVSWFWVFSFLIWIWLVQNRALGRLVLGACSGSKVPSNLVSFLRWLASLQLAVVFLPALACRFAAHVRASPEVMVLIQNGGRELSSSLSFFTLSAWVFLALSIVLFATLGGGVFFFAAIWLRARKAGCPTCGYADSSWRQVGVNCSGCSHPRAGWFYLQPTKDRLTDTSVGGHER